MHIKDLLKRVNSPLPKAAVAPIVVKNRIQQRLTRISGSLYLKVVQELLEMGDAIRVSQERLARDNENESDSELEEDDYNEYYSSTYKLRQRKMSLTGVLEQSAAETFGFAALLEHKLNQLLIEDDIEPDASYLINRHVIETRKQVSDSAPPFFSSNKGSFQFGGFDYQYLFQT